MNILLVGSYEQSEVLTGPQKFAKRLFKQLQGSHSVTFITYFQDGTTYSRWSKIFGHEVIEQYTQSQVIRCGLLPFVLLLLIRPFEIVHIVTFERFAIVAALVRSIKRYKLVYTCHGVIAFEYRQFYQHLPKRIKKTGQWIEKKFFQCADTVAFVSALEMRSAQTEGYHAVRYTIIHNGVDEIFYCSERHSISENHFSLVFVGNIHKKEKGFSFFVEALQRYKKEIEVTIVSAEIREQVFPSNIHLSFVRPMDTGSLAKLFQKNDLYICASAYDSFSITAAEAMASGAVPVVTSTTGIAELISHGRNGFIIEYGDSGQLCNVISILQDDRIMLSEISKNAQTTSAQYTWMQVAQEYERMYQSLSHNRIHNPAGSIQPLF